MDRPRCKTCPHFDSVDVDYEGPEFEYGRCLRFPPVYIGPHEDGELCGHANIDQWNQPWVAEHDACGEHPSFPAYIASLKKEPMSDNEPLDLSGLGSRAQRAILRASARTGKPYHKLTRDDLAEEEGCGQTTINEIMNHFKAHA